MKAILTVHNIASELVTSFWTPVFVGIFIAIVTYALWPRNQAAFDEAAKMPLREERSDHDRTQRYRSRFRKVDHGSRVGRHQGTQHAIAALVGDHLLRDHSLS